MTKLVFHKIDLGYRVVTWKLKIFDILNLPDYFHILL